MDFLDALEPQYDLIGDNAPGNTSSYIKEIKVQARWDGKQEHAVVVSVNYIISGRPGTRLGLVHTEDPLIASQDIHSTIHEWIQDTVPVPKATTGHSKELSGDTLTASEAESCVHNLRKNSSPKIGSSLGDVEDVKSAKNHGRFESPPITPKIKETCPTPEYCLSAVESHRMDTASPQRDIYSPLSYSRDSPETNDKISERSLYKAHGCLQSLEEPSPIGAVWPVNVSRRASAKRQKHIQRIKACRPVIDTPTRQPRKPMTELGYSSSRQRHHEYRPFSRCIALRTSLQPLSSRYVLNGVDQSGLGLGCICTSDLFQVKDDSPLPAPLIKDPKPPASIDLDRDPTIDTPSPLTAASQKLIKVPACLVSPNESLSGWLCRRFCSTSWYSLRQTTPKSSAFSSSSDASEDEAVVHGASYVSSVASERSNSMDAMTHSLETAPSTALVDGTIVVCFPKSMPMGIYEVQLDMEISLTEPDTLLWQSFGLPRLLKEKCSTAKGIFEFSFLPEIIDKVDATPAQFYAAGGVVFQEVRPRLLKASFAIYQAFLLRVRLRTESHRIERWDAAVTIYSVISDKGDMGMNIKHNVGLTIVRPRQDLFTQRCVFTMLIKNGPRDSGVYRLKSGQCLLRLQKDAYALKGSRDTVEIVVERDYQDMDKRLGVEFACNYADVEEVSVSLPVISSEFGLVLSEKLWLLKPFPPLKLHAISQRFSSTWYVNKQRIGKKQLLSFERKKMPPLYPRHLAEDAIVSIRRLTPVTFKQDVIENRSCDVIPAFNMVVDIFPQKRLECRMSFSLEAGSGSHQRLVQFDAIGWEPKYALVNGRLCTDRNAQWFYDDEHISLLETTQTALGEKLRIEIAFEVHPYFEKFQFSRERGDQVQTSYPLPCITDKTILGGSLKCSYDNTRVDIRHPSPADPQYDELFFLNTYGEDTRRFPTMRRGHELHISWWMLRPRKSNRSTVTSSTSNTDRIRFSGGLPLSQRQVHFDDKNPDKSHDSDDECDDSSSSSNFVSVKSAPQATGMITHDSGQPSMSKAYMNSQQECDSCPNHANIDEVLGEGSSQVKVESLHDSAKEPSLDASSTKRNLNTKKGKMITKSNGQDGSEAETEGTVNETDSDHGDAASHSTAENDLIDGDKSNAPRDDTPDSSDDRKSNLSDRDALNRQNDNGQDFDDDSDDSDVDDVLHGVNVGVRLINSLIDIAAHVIPYLERRSPMHFLVRFLMVEGLFLGTMPNTYFGGEPVRAVQSVVSNILAGPAEFVLGDLDNGMQPAAETPTVVKAANTDYGPVIDEPSAAIQDTPQTTASYQSLRDRIDLALGWRPIP